MHSRAKCGFADPISHPGLQTQDTGPSLGKGARLWKVARPASQAGSFHLLWKRSALGKHGEQQTAPGSPWVTAGAKGVPQPIPRLQPRAGRTWAAQRPLTCSSQAADERGRASWLLTRSRALCELQEVKITQHMAALGPHQWQRDPLSVPLVPNNSVKT